MVVVYFTSKTVKYIGYAAVGIIGLVTGDSSCHRPVRALAWRVWKLMSGKRGEYVNG